MKSVLFPISFVRREGSSFGPAINQLGSNRLKMRFYLNVRIIWTKNGALNWASFRSTRRQRPEDNGDDKKARYSSVIILLWVMICNLTFGGRIKSLKKYCLWRRDIFHDMVSSPEQGSLPCQPKGSTLRNVPHLIGHWPHSFWLPAPLCQTGNIGHFLQDAGLFVAAAQTVQANIYTPPTGSGQINRVTFTKMLP